MFVLLGFERRSMDFVIIPPDDLLHRLNAIHRKGKIIQSYVWVTDKSRCWETRGLKPPDQLAIAENRYSNAERDLSVYLNNWKTIQTRNEG